MTQKPEGGQDARELTYAREHAARQADPDGFVRFARSHPQNWPTGVDAINGVRADGTTQLQSVRFESDAWTPARAATWLASSALKTDVEAARADAPDVDVGRNTVVYADESCARFDGVDVELGAIERRYDEHPLQAPERTKFGFLRAEGRITRAGVFNYPEFGRRELRPPEEVFRADALRAFALMPVTLGHPPDNLTPETAARYAVGAIGEPRRDGDVAKAAIVIHDARAIAAVEAGQNKLSCGYDCRILPRGGVYVRADGVEEPFDAVQTRIENNHLALVHVARAGADIELRKDERRDDTIWTASYVNDLPDSAFLHVESGGSVDKAGKTVPRSLRHFPVRNAEGEIDLAHVRNALARIPQSAIDADVKERATARAQKMLDESTKKDGETLVKITMNGTEHEVTDALAAQIKALEAASTQARADASTAAGKLAAAESEAQKRADAAALEAAKKTQADAVTAKLAIVAKAVPVLGKTVDELVRMDDGEIMRAVIAKQDPTIKLDGRDQHFVAGVFEALSSKRVDTAAALNSLLGGPRADGEAAKSFAEVTEAARKKAIDERANAWKQKGNGA